MFKKLIQRFKQWRAECKAEDARIEKEQREKMDLRLKEMRESEASRRAEANEKARQAFCKDVYELMTFVDERYNHLSLFSEDFNKELEELKLLMGAKDSSYHRRKLEYLMTDPILTIEYVKAKVVQEIERYSRHEAEGCSKYYALKTVEDSEAELEQKRLSRYRRDIIINRHKHVASTVQWNVFKLLMEEVLARRTRLSWPTLKEITESGQVILETYSIPYQRAQKLPADFREKFLERFTPSVIEERIQKHFVLKCKPIFGDADDGYVEEKTLLYPWTDAIYKDALSYVAYYINTEWEDELRQYEAAFWSKEAVVRKAHRKRHQASHQKSLTTTGVTKRFPITRSFK